MFGPLESITQLPLNAALSGGVVLKGPFAKFLLDATSVWRLRMYVSLKHMTVLEFHREEPSGCEHTGCKRHTAIAVEVIAHGHISWRSKQA